MTMVVRDESFQVLYTNFLSVLLSMAFRDGLDPHVQDNVFKFGYPFFTRLSTMKHRSID